MKAHIRIILLLSLLGAFMCFGILSSGQRLSATKATLATTEDLALYLDGELIGSAANTQPLEDRFRSLKARVDARQGNLNYNVGPGGGRLTIGRLVLFPDKQLSAGQLGKVWDKIYEFFDDPAFERAVLWRGGSCEKLPARQSVADGSVFVLSNESTPMGELKKIRENEQCWLPASIVTTDQSLYSKQHLKSYRVSASSLEITNSGSYILNERASDPRHRVSTFANLAHPAFRRKLAAAKVKSRSLDRGSLEDEVRSWTEKRGAEGSEELVWDDNGSIALPIIINSRASYSSLAQILRLIDHPNVRLVVIVDSTVSP